MKISRERPSKTVTTYPSKEQQMNEFLSQEL